MVNAKKVTKTNKNKNPNNNKSSMSKIAEDDESIVDSALDDDLNSGFGNYLRSGEGS